MNTENITSRPCIITRGLTFQNAQFLVFNQNDQSGVIFNWGKLKLCITRTPIMFTHRQIKLLLQITTAAKQTIAKAWKTPTLTLAETKHRINQAMIYVIIEAICLDRVPHWHRCVTHYFPVEFNESLLQPW